MIEAEPNERVADLDRAMIINLYKRFGALLLRGFGCDVAALRGFAHQFCTTSVFNESPGREMIDAVSNILTVDGGVRAFALHPELSREPWKPDVAFFCCLTAPAKGGRTTICDGIALVRAMPDVVRQGLAERRLVYIMPTWPDLLRFWLGTPTPTDMELAAPPSFCPYEFRRFEDRILRLFSRPALHKTMFCNALAFGNFLLFARFNNNRLGFPVLDDGSAVPDSWLIAIRDAGDRIAIAIEWIAGDLLMIDNTRFLHGRTAITEPAERRIATYFGYLNFAIPDTEEPKDAIWRCPGFRPPLPPKVTR